MKLDLNYIWLLFLLLFIILVVQLTLQKDQPTWLKSILTNPDTPNLPYAIFRTMLRMVCAYALVILFAVPYGVIAGLYKGPQKFMLPLLDILQSIPVLGYLPPAILFFTARFSGTIALELAAIALIFTGEAWAVAFGVYGGVRNIPADMKTVGRAFGMRGLRYIRYVVLPSIFPPFITGSVLAWGGGWYFLIAAEFITYGGVQYTKDFPGIGNYIAKSVYVYHNIPSAIFGLAILAFIIYLINTFVWRPLMTYSEKFKNQTMDIQYARPTKQALVVRVIEAVRAAEDHLYTFLETRGIFKKANEFLAPIYDYKPPKIQVNLRAFIFRRLVIFAVLFVIIMYFIGLFVADALKKPLQDFQLSVSRHPEAYMLPLYTFYSVLRITVAYFIALLWTLAAGILIARSKLLSNLFLPLFDIGQSIPALALFPFVILVILHFIGGEGGLELASIVLLLTGTQWYLLFNIIGAIKSIPGDIIEASQAFGLKGWKFIGIILLPAIFPGIIVGSIQAWGGAWNALIVSEYMNFGGYVPVTVSYTGVALDSVSIVSSVDSRVDCSAGSCIGFAEVQQLGMQNATFVARSGANSINAPLSFDAESVGTNLSAGATVQAPFMGGMVTLISPSPGSVIPVRPYSVQGLGSFLDKATSEWGDPNLVMLAIAAMTLTILPLNAFVWKFLFTKAERYKFEMT